MKTKTPTSPVKLRLLGRTLHRVSRHNEGLALHGQLRLALLQCIHGGHWTAGDRVPTEAELIEATALSAGTVQRALRDLTDEGVLRRQQGSGSFVASAPNRIDDVAHCRFFDHDGVTVLPVFSRILSRKPAPRKGPWTVHFPADAQVVRLDRVLTVNDEFDVYSRFFFDGGRFPGLASRPVGELAGANFRLLLSQEGQAPAGGVTETLRLVQATTEVARGMGVAEGSWVAHLEIVRHIAGGAGALYYLQMYVPPTERPLAAREAV
jgi:GntR family transcriptional regulator